METPRIISLAQGHITLFTSDRAAPVFDSSGWEFEEDPVHGAFLCPLSLPLLARWVGKAWLQARKGSATALLGRLGMASVFSGT